MDHFELFFYYITIEPDHPFTLISLFSIKREREREEEEKKREKMSGVAGGEEDKKPAGDQSGHINLKVKSQVFFLIILLGFVFYRV